MPGILHKNEVLSPTKVLKMVTRYAIYCPTGITKPRECREIIVRFFYLFLSSYFHTVKDLG